MANIKQTYLSQGAVHIMTPIVVLSLIALIGVRLLFTAHAETNGTTYYVSSTGSDSNDGLSTSTPWQTVSKVNATHFNPGDSILFEGGDTFNGKLSFSPSESGTASSPIMISSYGNGDATINAGNSDAIYVYDAGGYKIANLDLIGSGASSNTGSGVSFYNDLPGNITLGYIYASNITASGFSNGMSVGGGKGASGYSDVAVTHDTFHDNAHAGLQTYGPTPRTSPTYVNHTVTVQYVTVYNNDDSSPSTAPNPGGIVLGNVDGASVSYSSVYNNGSACAMECGAGILTHDSKNITIEHSLSYANRTNSSADGDGFALGENTSNSTLQYNYAYNNDGAAFLLAGSSDRSRTGNTVRFNISQNDARKNSYGSISAYSNANSDAIYNNTVYLSPSANGATPAGMKIYGGDNITVRNNIFYATGGLCAVSSVIDFTTSNVLFQQNDYYPFAVNWGSHPYATLNSWRSATGEETLNDRATGLVSYPGLTDAGKGSLLTDPTTLGQLTQYELINGSAAKNIGLNLKSQFNTNVGSVDFYGALLPNSSQLSIGAAE